MSDVKKFGKSRNVGEKNPSAKLTRELAEEIRRRVNSGEISGNQAAFVYKVSRATIGLIMHNKTWRQPVS